MILNRQNISILTSPVFKLFYCSGLNYQADNYIFLESEIGRVYKDKCLKMTVQKTIALPKQVQKFSQILVHYGFA